MAKILPDRQIKDLLGKALIGAEESLLNPNGIELRLGRHVRFHSTGEDYELSEGTFLKVAPGETVSIASVESIDFTRDTAQAIYPDHMLMGLITPTTTMMREGISQATTKIDAGFRGTLSWGLRNGSTKDLILQHGEPIFKLTVFLLDHDESPDVSYGDRTQDTYQDSEGIARSKRRIPADIPKSKMIASSFDKLDPKQQLREAGYPFDHIGTELTDLHGKFEVVSTDVRLMQSKLEEQVGELSEKIADTGKSVLATGEHLFDRKLVKAGGIILGTLPMMYGGVQFLRDQSLPDQAIALVSVMAGFLIFGLAFLLSKRSSP